MWKNYPRNMPYKAKPNNYKCTTYLCDIKSHCAIDMHYAIVQGLTVFPKKTCSMEGSRHYITSPKKPTSQNFFVVCTMYYLWPKIPTTKDQHSSCLFFCLDGTYIRHC